MKHILENKTLLTAYAQLHVAVFLFGFTAIFGDLISLDSLPLVWWRVSLTCLSIVLFVRLPSLVRDIGWRHIRILAFIGVITGIHWVAFYGSIKYANASIALICLATASFFTAIAEPIVLKQKFNLLDLGVGLIIIPAMVLIVSDLHSGYYLGIGMGLLASLLAAIFTALNKKYIEVTTPMRMTFVELGSAMLFLSLVMTLRGDWTSAIALKGNDVWYIILLALVCTTLTQYLCMASLKHISAFNSVLIINLEPIYGIILAAIILNEHEQLTPTFYVGASVIILSVMLYPMLKKRLIQ